VGEFVGASNGWATELLTWTVTQSAPTAPIGLAATANSSSQVTVTWTDNANEASYSLERGTDGVNFSMVAATITANTTSYVDSGLSASTRYYYRLQDHNAVGDSPYSAVASATTPAPPPPAPAAPSGLNATSVAKTAVTLAWVDNAGNEDGFRLEVSVNGRAFSQIATLPANTTGYSHTGLKSRTTYSYRVRAYNAGGPSAYSNTVTVKTP